MWQFGLVATSELLDDSISAGGASHLNASLSYRLHLWYVLISTNWTSELIRFYKSCKYCMIHLLYCLQSCGDAGGEEKGVFLGNKEPLFCSVIPAQCLYYKLRAMQSVAAPSFLFIAFHLQLHLAMSVLFGIFLVCMQELLQLLVAAWIREFQVTADKKSLEISRGCTDLNFSDALRWPLQHITCSVGNLEKTLTKW